MVISEISLEHRYRYPHAKCCLVQLVLLCMVTRWNSISLMKSSIRILTLLQIAVRWTTVDAIPMRSAHTMEQQMPWNALARQDTQTPVLILMWSAQVRTVEEVKSLCDTDAFLCHISAESCQVKNGGCDANSICSHDGTTNDVKCTCKTGYTNTGYGVNINCTGMYSNVSQETSLSIFIVIRFWHVNSLNSTLILPMSEQRRFSKNWSRISLVTTAV